MKQILKSLSEPVLKKPLNPAETRCHESQPAAQLPILLPKIFIKSGRQVCVRPGMELAVARFVKSAYPANRYYLPACPISILPLCFRVDRFIDRKRRKFPKKIVNHGKRTSNGYAGMFLSTPNTDINAKNTHIAAGVKIVNRRPLPRAAMLTRRMTK